MNPFFGRSQLDFRKSLYITLTFGEEMFDERFPDQITKCLSFTYSIHLICNVNKKSEMMLLDLQCKVIYLVRDLDVYFLQIIAEGWCTCFLSLKSFSRVDECDRQ